MELRSSLKSFFLFIVAFILFILVRLVLLTCKKDIVKPQELIDLENSNRPFIYAFWHGRMFAMPAQKPKHRDSYSIISRHGDGQLLAYFLGFYGQKEIRGSADRPASDGVKVKNRGGSQAIRDSVRKLKEGNIVVITPDGPKGPAFKMKENFLPVLAMTGAPIITMTFSANRAKIFNSWDKFMVPMPFSTLKLRYGTLHYIPKEDSRDIEKYGKQIEDELNNMTRQLDAEFGHQVL